MVSDISIVLMIDEHPPETAPMLTYFKIGTLYLRKNEFPRLFLINAEATDILVKRTSAPMLCVGSKPSPFRTFRIGDKLFTGDNTFAIFLAQTLEGEPIEVTAVDDPCVFNLFEVI